MYHISAALESFVVGLREGIEVALVIGVLLAYLARTGRSAYGRCAFLGMGVALLASLGIAAGVHRYGIDPDNPAAEGSVMFIAAGLVASLVGWMWRTGRSVRPRMEKRLDALMETAAAGPLDLRAALGVFAFAFVMVSREGVETVLFLAALSGTPGGSALTAFGGGGFGLALAALFGVLLVRGSVRINLRRFFGVTGIALVALVVKLVAGATHEFFEAGVLPAAPFWQHLVDVIVSGAASLLILAFLIAAPLGILAWEWRMSAPLAPREQSGTARS